MPRAGQGRFIKVLGYTGLDYNQAGRVDKRNLHGTSRGGAGRPPADIVLPRRFALPYSAPDKYYGIHPISAGDGVFCWGSVSHPFR